MAEPYPTDAAAYSFATVRFISLTTLQNLVNATSIDNIQSIDDVRCPSQATQIKLQVADALRSMRGMPAAVIYGLNVVDGGCI